jgi:succinate dehydrogenase flavin-adding protein (antitoxin of CptAB toxin-antitoxin module)
MRELDLLLVTYLEHHYPQAADDKKQAFRELLALADPLLHDYLLGGQMPGDAALASVVSKIRDRHHA